MEYGLIGEKLGHSFSQPIHEQLGGYAYQLHPLSPQELPAFLTRKAFRGINVTIPYKQAVIPFLDRLDDRARRIGAVNTIVHRDGVLTGYNTDYDGFAALADSIGADFAGRVVLLLGSGGTSHTVTAVARDRGAARILVASRSGREGCLTYEEAMDRGDAQILVNVSPAGMYPHNGDCLVDLDRFPRLEAVIDVVYNPLATRLVLLARERGIPAAGGLRMLVEQAREAAQLFTGRPISQEKADETYRKLKISLTSPVLVGMPSAGKTTVGQKLAQALGREFLDLDALLVEEAGRPIRQIFQEEGEAAFRRMERDLCARITQRGGPVIATGGGIVKDRENWYSLRQNGVVLWLDRPLDSLAVDPERPLSCSREALEAMSRERLPLYEGCSDERVANSQNPDRAARTATDFFIRLAGR